MALVEVEDLRKQYGSITAVDGVSFEIQEGEVFSLLGPNGAGKSTSIGMLTALIEPSGGDARINGVSVRGRSAALRRQTAVRPGGGGIRGRSSAWSRSAWAIILRANGPSVRKPWPAHQPAIVRLSSSSPSSSSHSTG